MTRLGPEPERVAALRGRAWALCLGAALWVAVVVAGRVL